MGYFYEHARDPISSFTHWIGMCCAAVGSLLLVLRGIIAGKDPVTILCALVFGFSLVALYAASTLYHFYQGRPNPAAAAQAGPFHYLCPDRRQLYPDHLAWHGASACRGLPCGHLVDCGGGNSG